MKKLTILALHLNFGGIEQAITNLANSLCDNYKVEIIVNYKMIDKPAFVLDKRIKVTYTMEGLYPNARIWFKYLKSFRFIKWIKESFYAFKVLYLKYKTTKDAIKSLDSDIVISNRVFQNYLLGKYGNKNILKIAWEHNYPRKLSKLLVIKSTKKIDYLVLPTEEIKSIYELKTKAKCIFIPHMINDLPKSISSYKENELIAVGRLSPEKGFLDLVEVIALVKQKINNIHLSLIGDGVEYKKIEQKIKEYRLEKNITLYGFKDKEFVNKKYSEASIYLMTSFTESFGLVILEAMSYGIPCIAFSSAQGACNLIDNNKNGLIIPNRNKQEMANNIIKLVKNKKKISEMGDECRHTAKKYEKNDIVKQWKKILEGDFNA